MNIKTTAENRPAMVKAIANHLNLESQYQGPPSFAYVIGELTINRDGSIEAESADALECIKPFLIEKGWMAADAEQFIIELPTIGMNNFQLCNIVNMVHSKQYLLNRIMRAEYISISQDFVQTLKRAMESIDFDFLTEYEQQPEDACKGLSFSEDRVAFVFKMEDDPDRTKAYMELASSIVSACRLAKRVSPTPTISENEKFYLRAWLVRIGMDGSEYKSSRRELLKGLKGHTAFKTEEQKERHRIKHQAKKEVPMSDLENP